MATLSFLLDPEKEIPEQVDPEWFGRCAGFMNGTFMAWRRLALEQPPRPWFQAPSLTSNAADYMAFNRPEDREQYTAYVEKRHAEWVATGRPDVVVAGGPADYAAWSGDASRIALRNLSGNRGLNWSKPKQGAHGIVHNQGDPYKFDLCLSESVELAVLAEIARAYGGTHLAMWTYGHSLQMVVFRAASVFSWSVRLRAGQRRPELLARLREAFQGSQLQPDWKVLEEQLQAPEIRLVPWFAAFGLTGAMELIPEEAPALWDQLESEGARLLRGENADPARLKQVNKFLSNKLPAKPGKGLARRLFGSILDMASTVGWSTASPPWSRRWAAAQQYWSIVDGPGCDSLTVGVDKKGLGQSAALGRLQPFYQGVDFRDGLFWSLAACQAESANGHAFVAAMESAAESCHSAGLVAVILPEASQAKFRADFGISDGQTEAERGWAAEVFLDLPGLLKADARLVAGEWLSKKKVDGLVVRAEADGSIQAQTYRKGKADSEPLFPDFDAGALSQAARELSCRGVLQALGFQKLLAPAAEVVAKEPAGGLSRSAVQQGLAQDGARRSVSLWNWGEALPARGKPVYLRLEVGCRDELFLRQLRDDIDAFARLCWLEDNVIWAGKQDSWDVETFVSTLGDLPPGTVISFRAGEVVVNLEFD